MSRRKLLAGIAATGAGGAAIGGGSAALLSDAEPFKNGVFAVGEVDLHVGWDGGTSRDGSATLTVDLSDGTKSGSELLTVSLPSTGQNNPAYVWLAGACPPDNRLTDALSARLVYVDCDNGDELGELVGWTELAALADRLLGGVPLDATGAIVGPGDQACLAAESAVCLRLEWELDDEYDGDESTTLDFQFVGRQCRHNDGATNPFPPAGEPCVGGHDISWVAFCAESGETLDDSDLEFSVEGDTLTLENDPANLGTIALKYSDELRVFEYTGSTDTFQTADGGTTYDQEGSGYVDTARTNKTPCPESCGVKYQWPDWETPEKETCNDD